MMDKFVKKFAESAKIWKNTNLTLGPLLREMHGSKNARALSSQGGVLDISNRQKAYAEAIKPIVSTWQKLEEDGIAACPWVMKGWQHSGSLACRVNNFTTNPAGSQWQ